MTTSIQNNIYKFNYVIKQKIVIATQPEGPFRILVGLQFTTNATMHNFCNQFVIITLVAIGARAVGHVCFKNRFRAKGVG